MPQAADRRRAAWFALVTATACSPAFAYGQQFLFVGAAGLGLAAGAVFGTVAGLRAKARSPGIAQAALTALALGMVIGVVTTQSAEGAVFFLVFGAVGGAIPFVLGYYACRLMARHGKAAFRRRRGAGDLQP